MKYVDKDRRGDPSTTLGMTGREFCVNPLFVYQLLTKNKKPYKIYIR